MLLVWACCKRRAPIGTFLAFVMLLLLLAMRLPPSPRQAVNTASTRPTSTVTTQTTTTQATTVKAIVIKSTESVTHFVNHTTILIEPAAVAPLPGAAGAVLTRNLYVAGYTRPHLELCPDLGAHVRLVILVASAPSHFSARRAIRLTWGGFAQSQNVVVGFMLGKPQDVLRWALDKEDSLYGDIIEGRNVDTHSNLTLKSISMLEWMTTYCPLAPRLLKTDDDTVVNIEKVLQFVEAPDRSNATFVLWGRVHKGKRPIRWAESKYFVSSPEFPAPVFPDYASGPAYLITSDAVRRMAHAAGRENFFRIEDLFVTGLLAEKTGVKRKNVKGFLKNRVTRDPCQSWMVVHGLDIHEHFNLWHNTVDGKHKCYVPTPT